MAGVFRAHGSSTDSALKHQSTAPRSLSTTASLMSLMLVEFPLRWNSWTGEMLLPYPGSSTRTSIWFGMVRTRTQRVSESRKGCRSPPCGLPAMPAIHYAQE